MIKLADSVSPIVHVPMGRGEGNFRIIRANGNIKSLIGFSPKVTLDEGLTKTISWYSKNLKELNEIYKFARARRERALWEQTIS